MKKNLLARSLLVCLLLVGTLALWYYKVPPFYQISLKFNDLNYILNTKYPDPTVEIVVVDEKSVNKYGRWPWNRELMAEGLKKLSGAKAIGMDIVFSEPSDEKSDAILANQIKNQANVVGGFFLRPNATQHPSKEQKDILKDSAMERLEGKLPFYKFPYAELNIEPILKNMQLSGCFSTIPDKDELFRRYPVGFVYDGSVLPSLGLQLLRYSLNQDVEFVEENGKQYVALHDIKVSLDDDGFALLNYYPVKSYNLISFADVLDGKVASSYFDNKIVIVGISEAGISDIRATPLGQVTGAILHATFVSNVLQGSTIKLDKVFNLIVITIFILIPFLMQYIIKNISYRMTIYALTYVMYFSVAWVLYIKFYYWLDLSYPLIAILFSMVLNEFMTFKNDEEQARFIKGAFTNYMSQELLEKLVAEPQKLSLAGEEKELTILFSDIRNFTTISESLESRELVSLLNNYFTPLTKIIQEEHGTVDKYIGDAIMAFFNAPLDCENHPSVACACALKMQSALKLLNKELEGRLDKPLEMGIGINTDLVTVGNMGAENKFNYTAIGDGVNVASRLESLNKQYGSGIIISEHTKQYLSDDEFLCRYIGEVLLKGRVQKTRIYELLENNEYNRAKCDYFSDVVTIIDNGAIVSVSDEKMQTMQQMDEVGFGICKEKIEQKEEKC